MNDDQLSAVERAIIDQARPHEDPNDQIRDRVHGAVLARVAGAVAAGSVATAASASAKAAAGTSAAVFSGKTIASSLLIIASFAAVGVGAGLIARPDAPTPAPAVAPSVAPAAEPTAAVVEPEAAENRAPEPTAAEDPSPEDKAPQDGAPEDGAIAEGAPAPTSAAAPRGDGPSHGKDVLKREVELLQAAQKRLGSGDAAGALALLDEHAREYPSGVLQQEAAAARVLALCGVGRRAEARAAAQRFLQRTPASPLAERVRNACR